MKSTARKMNSLKNAAKTIITKSASSDPETASSRHVSGGCGDSSHLKALETVSTNFSDRSKSSNNPKFTRMVGNHPIAPNHSKFLKAETSDDVEMELDTATSFDSPMEAEYESVQAKVVDAYGAKLLQNLKAKETILTGEFEKHEIKNSHRKQMIVWMEEVLTIFKCPESTFFMAVHVMDRYLHSSSECLCLNDLHEIGIVCMFMASKYQEVDPLTLDLMIEKVAHGKITTKHLLDRERKIAISLKFKFGTPNVLNFIETYLEILSPKILSDDKVQLEENVIKIAKRSLLERKKAFNMAPSKLALYAIHKALRSLLELDSTNVLFRQFMKLIKNELTSDECLITRNNLEVKNFA